MFAYSVVIIFSRMVMSIGRYVWSLSIQRFWRSLRLVQWMSKAVFLSACRVRSLLRYAVLFLLLHISDIAILPPRWVFWWKVFLYYRHSLFLVWRCILFHEFCICLVWCTFTSWLCICCLILRIVWELGILCSLWSYFLHFLLFLGLDIFWLDFSTYRSHSRNVWVYVGSQWH